MVYCHEDTWAADEVYPVEFTAENLPIKGPYKVTRYVIDKDHSNAYAEWVRQGRPDYPAGEQFAAIQKRSGLELAEPVRTAALTDGKLKLAFDMPVKSVSFLTIEKA